MNEYYYALLICQDGVIGYEASTKEELLAKINARQEYLDTDLDTITYISEYSGNFFDIETDRLIVFKGEILNPLISYVAKVTLP
jgi:hypothetical protein